jgi:gamma-glutamyltranspeptidase/glutathione hydrolase/leukotriene-C4 hydrolase
MHERAIPGELKGFELAHKHFGKLPWKDLFQPAINMCENGFKLTKILSQVIESEESSIRENKALSDLLINSLNNTKKENDTIRCLNLAKTLKLVAENGANVFYNGTLTPILVKEINDNGIPF